MVGGGASPGRESSGGMPHTVNLAAPAVKPAGLSDCAGARGEAVIAATGRSRHEGSRQGALVVSPGHL